ncbi:MAG: pyruvate formate-lyase-activating protein [Lentisphaeria bacterium]
MKTNDAKYNYAEATRRQNHGKTEAVKGRIHSIETLSGVDGPGLRCVVFFQGCPLRCRYCHNPDTWQYEAGKKVTAKDVTRRIHRLRPYFGENGGVTLSGGEPLLQPYFAADILKRCQHAGIHTAIDTSGCCSRNALQKVLPWMDLALLDVKHTEPDAFRELTGGELCKTLETMNAFSKAGIPIWVRQVIIPGFNDTEEDALKLADMCAQFKTVRKIELLAYHGMGENKWQEVGCENLLAGTPSPPQDWVKHLQQLARISQKFGLKQNF